MVCREYVKQKFIPIVIIIDQTTQGHYSSAKKVHCLEKAYVQQWAISSSKAVEDDDD